MKKNRKLFVICILSLILIQLCGCTKFLEKTQKQAEQVETQLNKETNEKSEEIKKQEEQNHIKTDSSKIQDITKYPYIVKGNGEIDVEIYSSPNYAKERWIVEIINRFNERKNLVDGKVISVSLKSIPSEIIFEDIVSGKNIPDAITPENQFLPEMLQVKGVEYYQESNVLLKNALGIVIDETTYNLLSKNQKDIELFDVQQAMLNNEIKLGILDEYINSLNFIVSMLYSFDSENVISDIAIEQFEKFEAKLINIPEIFDNLDSRSLDGLILDYNSYVNKPQLGEYFFIPFGVVNNNPLYCNENISEQEKRVIKLFGYYATSIEAKKLAKQYGFIINNNYISEIPYINGETLLEIRKILENKI